MKVNVLSAVNVRQTPEIFSQPKSTTGKGYILFYPIQGTSAVFVE